MERTLRTDEEELCRWFVFRTPQELQRLLREWKDEYNHRRPHLALRGRPPGERLCEFRIHHLQIVGRSA